MAKHSQLDKNPVIESADFIHECSKDVFVLKDSIDKAAERIHQGFTSTSFSVATWKTHPLNPRENSPATVDWQVAILRSVNADLRIFFIDLLNFSFWSDRDLEDGSESSGRYAVEYRGKKWTGYWSLCAAVNRSLDEGIPITSASFFGDTSKCTDDIVKHVFRSATSEPIPLLNERIEAMREAGKILNEHYQGSFRNLISEAKGDAMLLLSVVSATFSSFQDYRQYKGRTVYFFKRAQILIADLWACFEGHSYGAFNNIAALTVFADYRIPQALHVLGCMQYSDRLKQILEKRELIEAGSDLEIEIRGNSIYACCELTKAVNAMSGKEMITNVLLDFYIWDWVKELQDSREEQQRMGNTVEDTVTTPFHRTRSIYY